MDDMISRREAIDLVHKNKEGQEIIIKDDTISRRAAINELNERQRKLIYCFGFENDLVKIMDITKSIILTLPSTQPERKRGHWIEVDDDLISGKCSVCGWEAHLYEDDVVGMDFCPNCGSYNGGEK